MNVYLFEEKSDHFLLPMTYFKHISEIRLGTKTIFDKWKNYFSSIGKIGRYYLIDSKPDDEAIFINARVLPDDNLASLIKRLELSSVIKKDEKIIAFKTKGPLRDSDGFIQLDQFNDFKSISADSVKYLKYPWDIIFFNSDEISRDLKNFTFNQSELSGVTCLNKKDIYVDKSVTILPGTIINAEKGPVIIEKNTKIGANVYLEGPLYIAENCEIRHISKIWNTSIHNACKAGGEISTSVMLECSNKVHDGFLGHSLLGSWTNIGAGTNVSNLKNNYKDIIMMYFNETINTGSQFLGLIFGDHSKTAINSTFNTGSIIGINTNIFGTGIPVRMVQSFIWGGIDSYEMYHLEAAKKVAKSVMSRRGIDFNSSTDTLFDNVYKLVQRLEY